MHMLRNLLPCLVGATLAFVGTLPTAVRADDTDLYVHPNYTGGGSDALPHVMFTLDYRANLGSVQCTNPSIATCNVTAFFIEYEATKAEVQAKIDAGDKISYFDLLRWALKVVFSEYTGFKAGLMVSHAHSNNCAGPGKTGCSNGGYVLQGFRDMGDADNQANFHGILSNMKDPGGALAHSYQLKELLFEFYRYLKGWKVYNGHNGYVDWNSGGNPNSNRNVGASNDQTNNNHLLGWDEKIEDGTTYYSPFGADSSCTKLFAIHFIFGVTNQEDDSDAAIKATADDTNQGMGLTTLSNGTTGAVQMVSYMKNNDLSGVDGTQSVTQYFVTDATSTSIRQLAAAGGTSVVEIGSDPQDLVDELAGILNEILSVSTTFVSASVPVNVFNRAESLDNVFIALFQADEDKHPFWDGNVKKLKLKLSTVDGEDQVNLVDALGVNAIANDGRINYDALTFWTKSGNLPDPTGDEVDERDGRGVARGAAGHRMPGFIDVKPSETNSEGLRTLYYDPDAGTTLQDLNADATTAAALVDDMGLGLDVTTALSVLYWSRGWDLDDDEGDGDKTRSWWFGDPLHSRPLPINYGLADGHSKDTNPLIYIAVGTNDGYMRFIRNSLSTEVDTQDGAGEEVWAFMPRKVMPNVATMYQKRNNPIDHPYGVDGPPTSLTIDKDGDGTVETADGDKVYLYFGLRRGGRAIYALDVSKPEAPSLAWRIDNSTTGFSELGYTFSPPKTGLINLGSGDVRIVAFAGGYDLNKDGRTSDTSTGAQTAPGSNDTYGNAFYVVNAETGALIFKATYGASTGLSGTTYSHSSFRDSVPSEIALLDGDGDGYTDRAVFGDTGGNVWRVDMAPPSAIQTGVVNWRISHLARLGRHWNNDINDDRRFFHRPDVVPSKDASGDFDAVVIGSGDRANPLDRASGHTGNSLDEGTTQNWMYMIKDRKITTYVSGDTVVTPVDHDDLFDVTDNCLASGSCGDTSSLAKGWRLELEVGPGEKSLSSPVTVTNTVFFTTFLPLGTDSDITTTTTEDGVETATCGPQEGKGLLYAIDLATAKPVTNFNVSRDSISSTTTDASNRYSVLASAGIPADVVTVSLGGQTYVLPPDLKPSGIESSTRWRTFWYRVDDETGP